MPNRVLTPVTELDFDGIKQNLKNYLSSNGDFTDFDYEGSAMNILLDILAYNTHYTAMYANMVAAESFMDSAVLRRSVVSLAKNLGHVPSSRTAATAKLSLSFGQTAGVPSTLPKGTKFYASKDGSSYTFSTVEPFAIDRTAEPYTCENFTIRQGVYASQTFLYDVNSNSTKFEIVSTKLDKSLLEVYILSSPPQTRTASASGNSLSMMLS